MKCHTPYFDGKLKRLVGKDEEFQEGMEESCFKLSNTEKAEALKAEINKPAEPVQGEPEADSAQEEAVNKRYAELYPKAKELLPDATPQGLSRALKAYVKDNLEGTVEDFVTQYKAK